MADQAQQKIAVTPVAPVSVPEHGEQFWREVVRVQFDKAVLLMLVIILHHWHAPDTLQAAAIGALIVLIQGQRFRLSINRN